MDVWPRSSSTITYQSMQTASPHLPLAEIASCGWVCWKKDGLSYMVPMHAQKVASPPSRQHISWESHQRVSTTTLSMTRTNSLICSTRLTKETSSWWQPARDREKRKMQLALSQVMHIQWFLSMSWSIRASKWGSWNCAIRGGVVNGREIGPINLHSGRQHLRNKSASLTQMMASSLSSLRTIWATMNGHQSVWRTLLRSIRIRLCSTVSARKKTKGCCHRRFSPLNWTNLLTSISTFSQSPSFSRVTDLATIAKTTPARFLTPATSTSCSWVTKESWLMRAMATISASHSWTRKTQFCRRASTLWWLIRIGMPHAQTITATRISSWISIVHKLSISSTSKTWKDWRTWRRLWSITPSKTLR